MSETTTITVRIPKSVKADLDALARDTKRSRSYLAAEAVAEFVAQETVIVGKMLKGMEDFEAERVISHEAAIARLRATVDRNRSRKAA